MLEIHEHARVRVEWSPEDVLPGGRLNDAAIVHDKNPVSIGTCDFKIVGNQQHRHSPFFLNCDKKVKQLELQG